MKKLLIVITSILLLLTINFIFFTGLGITEDNILEKNKWPVSDTTNYEINNWPVPDIS